jgi:hypothetical protein
MVLINECFEFKSEAQSDPCQHIQIEIDRLESEKYIEYGNAEKLSNGVKNLVIKLKEISYLECKRNPNKFLEKSNKIPFENLLSDKGNLKIQRNETNLSYFSRYPQSNQLVKGYINIFYSSEIKILGTFKDINRYGCIGSFTLEKIRSGRWISIWEPKPYTAGDKCDEPVSKVMVSEK